VPGTGNDLTNVDDQIRRADVLQGEAMRADRGASTSVVSWLGYDAPEADGSVVTTGRADASAQDLRSFTHGLRESHQGEPTHMTVLGHSYGSTMVGAATSGGEGLGADDVVVVGSPGMTVDHASTWTPTMCGPGTRRTTRSRTSSPTRRWGRTRRRRSSAAAIRTTLTGPRPF
jgi:hypothetical protein